MVLTTRRRPFMNQPKKPTLIEPVAQKQTVVEEGTRLKGSLTSTCRILVQGSIEGEGSGPAITVGATGEPSGTTTSGALKSEGKISGTFDVDTAEVGGVVAKNTILR